MRVLLLNQFFWPDSAATSQLLTDLARGLAERGHEVHAICAEPGYALQDETNPPQAQVHRIPSVRFVRGPLGRVASYASFFLGSAWRGLRVPRPDVVITLTTPPLLSLVGNLVQFLRRSKHFIWEMDVYPDVAIDLQYVPKNGVFDRVIGTIAYLSRKRSDGILVLGACMRDRLLRRGLPASKVFIAENWADSKIIHPTSWPEPGTPLTILYSGNLGLAHDTDTIVQAMTALKNDKNFRFVFAGGGARRKPLESLCREREIRSVEFRSYSSKMSLGESLGSGHIGLITQQTACLGSVVPSKVYGLLAAGRPVLFIGPEESTVAQIIKRFDCGWHIPCGDASSLLDLLRALSENRTVVEQAGSRARQAFLRFYDLPHGVSRICALIGLSSPAEASHDSGAPEMKEIQMEENRFADVC
ncbi:MAG: glycosyltransferase family 4 protein [Acidobacteriaceae bacterium]|nr:glycosyltransferase family 4 protein [Acidobacteriaceae bacterium]